MRENRGKCSLYMNIYLNLLYIIMDNDDAKEKIDYIQNFKVRQHFLFKYFMIQYSSGFLLLIYLF